MILLKLDRRSSLPMIRSLMIRRRNLIRRRWVGGRYGGVVDGGIVCCSIVASLGLLLCAMVANCRIDEEAEEGTARANQYPVTLRVLYLLTR